MRPRGSIMGSTEDAEVCSLPDEQGLCATSGILWVSLTHARHISQFSALVPFLSPDHLDVSHQRTRQSPALISLDVLKADPVMLWYVPPLILCCGHGLQFPSLHQRLVPQVNIFLYPPPRCNISSILSFANDLEYFSHSGRASGPRSLKNEPCSCAGGQILVLVALSGEWEQVRPVSPRLCPRS
jgi:hypothetical protein